MTAQFSFNSIYLFSFNKLQKAHDQAQHNMFRVTWVNSERTINGTIYDEV